MPARAGLPVNPPMEKLSRASYLYFPVLLTLIFTILDMARYLSLAAEVMVIEQVPGVLFAVTFRILVVMFLSLTFVTMLIIFAVQGPEVLYVARELVLVVIARLVEAPYFKVFGELKPVMV